VNTRLQLPTAYDDGGWNDYIDIVHPVIGDILQLAAHVQQDQIDDSTDPSVFHVTIFS
jgi:hypothetical protein